MTKKVDDWTLDDFKKEVRRLDPSLKDEGGDYYKAAVVMLVALREGQNVRNLVRFTGYDAEFVKGLAGRLRENKIWARGKTEGDWFKKPLGGLNFWLDVAAGLGMLRRARGN